MDVHCSTCNEPWDTYHLWHEAIYETGLSEEKIKAWQTLPQKQKLSPRYRKKFEEAGYVFGQSVINVTHCPCCPKGATPDIEKVQMKAAIEELLCGDEDGIAATLEDHGL